MLTSRILPVILAAASSEAPPALAKNFSAGPAAQVSLFQQATQEASRSASPLEDAGSDRETEESDYAGSAGSDDGSAGESGDVDSVDAAEGDDSSESQSQSHRKSQSQSFATKRSKSWKPKAKAGGNEVKDTSLIRPNSGKRPDVIEVEIIMKNFMGVTFTANAFEADLILISRWRDNRTKALLQTKEKRTLSLSPADAQRTLWMPDIEILNREYQGLDILSSVVQVKADGIVEKIERSHARLKCHVRTNAFPYDTQTLRVKVASNSKMSDDVVLEAVSDDMRPGILPGTFGKHALFDYMSSEVRDYMETDGPLKKSRAELLVTVRRNMASCFSTILVPAFCIVSISWAGFFMPSHAPAFAMPRVTTSFVSFLMQVNFKNRIDKLQPDRGDASWLDILQECNEMCVFAAVVFTIAVLYTSFYGELPDLASQFDSELQWFLPLVSLILWIICYLYVGSTNTFQLSCVTRTVLFVAFGGESLLMFLRCRKAVVAKMPPLSKQIVHSTPLTPPHPVEVSPTLPAQSYSAAAASYASPATVLTPTGAATQLAPNPSEAIPARVLSSPLDAASEITETPTLTVPDQLFRTSPNLRDSAPTKVARVLSGGMQAAPVQPAGATVLTSAATQPVLAPVTSPAAVQGTFDVPARPM